MSTISLENSLDISQIYYCIELDRTEIDQERLVFLFIRPSVCQSAPSALICFRGNFDTMTDRTNKRAKMALDR